MAKRVIKSEEMSDLIKQWRASGSTKQSFCAMQNVNIHTFTYWLGKERQETAPKGFVEVLSDSSPIYVEFIFPQGAIMRLGSDISSAHVSLLKTLLY